MSWLSAVNPIIVCTNALGQVSQDNGNSKYQENPFAEVARYLSRQQAYMSIGSLAHHD